MKKTKIIATIGPASENREILKEMIKSGMNFARLNFSHGTYESHLAYINVIRKVASELGVKIPIIQDLAGPKLRLGEFDSMELREGDVIRFGRSGIPVQKEIWKWISNGQTILIDDGVVELLATEVATDYVKAKVVVAGTIKSRKGISLPGIKVDLPALSEKDIEDMKFGITHNVDAIALSFVKQAADIENLRAMIAEQTERKIAIVAKVETVEALENIDDIIKVSDVIMVARGDLGLNIDQHAVPIYQKKIISLCNKYEKPVIVATQMLESMTNNPRPTRAEVSDVANAVIDHADAVMLSGETAFGKYPVKTIQTMTAIIEQTESSPWYNQVQITKDLIKV